MKQKIIIIFSAITLCIVSVLTVNSFFKPTITSEPLNKSFNSGTVSGLTADEDFIMGQTDFAVSLLKNTVEEKNTLISPYSVMQALAMTANGADNKTKDEMEKVLGGIPIDKLNEYLYTFRTSKPDTESCKLNTANSIWFKENQKRIKISDTFLQKNTDYYNSSVFNAPFDSSTVDDINRWVNQNTNNMIPKLLNNIDENAVMYIINAITFEGKWEIPYSRESQVHTHDFTAYDNTVTQAEMMFSDEYFYLEDENATGFIKLYQEGRYAFAALLPNEGISIIDYINNLTAESLNETLSNHKNNNVKAAIPKFSYDYNIDLKETLKKMGMTDAFDTNVADFSKITEMEDNNNIYINSVLHKTHIDVFEAGTKAAALTSVECDVVGASPDNSIKKVILDRPFVYCIIDTETSIPIFIGAFLSIS